VITVAVLERRLPLVLVRLSGDVLNWRYSAQRAVMGDCLLTCFVVVQRPALPAEWGEVASVAHQEPLIAVDPESGRGGVKCEYLAGGAGHHREGGTPEHGAVEPDDASGRIVDAVAHPLQHRDHVCPVEGVDGGRVGQVVAQGVEFAVAHPQAAAPQLYPADVREAGAGIAARVVTKEARPLPLGEDHVNSRPLSHSGVA
jgi:hypothetical protein